MARGNVKKFKKGVDKSQPFCYTIIRKGKEHLKGDNNEG